MDESWRSVKNQKFSKNNLYISRKLYQPFFDAIARAF